MFRCLGKSKCDPEKYGFKVEAMIMGMAKLDPRGEQIGFEATSSDWAGNVRCAHCGARAEWQDVRQEELFPTIPEMF